MPFRVTGAEFARLSSLYRYGALGVEAEPAIAAAVQTLATRLRAPVAQLVLADAQRMQAIAGAGPAEPMFPRGRGVVEDLVTQGPAFQATITDDRQAMPPGPLDMKSFAGLRLMGSEDEAIGAVYVADVQPRDLSIEAPGPLAAAAADILAVLESVRRSRHDAGTGALDHHAFLDQARRLIEVSRLGHQWVSLVTIDLAPLREALERKRTGLGSLVVRQMADLGRTQVRRRDSFGRLGPDLFAILLTDTAEGGARVLAQRLTRHLERGWSDAGVMLPPLELGLASQKPAGAGDTAELLLARATGAIRSPAGQRPDARVA